MAMPSIHVTKYWSRLGVLIYCWAVQVGLLTPFTFTLHYVWLIHICNLQSCLTCWSLQSVKKNKKKKTFKMLSAILTARPQTLLNPVIF